MKLIIDDAHIDLIKKIYEYYPVDGVTTNPSILAKSGRQPFEVLKEIRSFIDFFHQMVEHFRRQGLGTVAEGFLRVIVDLDHETVGSGCDSCHGKRLHHEADACRMARVDDDRKMGLFL